MTKEERLLNAIFNEPEPEDGDYPSTVAEKVDYSGYVVTKSLQDMSTAIWRLSHLHNLLVVAEQDGGELPSIIANNELRMVLRPLLQVEGYIKEAAEMLRELYNATVTDTPAHAGEETEDCGGDSNG